MPELIAQPHIVHWHLHDNLGLGDDPHLAVGSGSSTGSRCSLRVRETVAGETARPPSLEVTSEDDVRRAASTILDEIEECCRREPAA